jgi:hypothetical protein
MKPLTIAFVASLACAANASAQPSATATIGGSFSSFRDAGASVERRQDVDGGASFEHLFDHERGRVYYDLDGGTYASPGDWSYYLHTIGLRYRFGADEPASRGVYLTASAALRRNGDAWAAADYSAFGGGLNAEFHPHTNVTLRTGYRADYRSFSDLTALTQLEHRGFASVLANLRTRTTVIAEVQVGAKSYGGHVQLDSTVATTTTATSTSQSYGQNRGMGPGLRWTTTVAQARTQDQSGAAGLASGLFRVAQSVSDRTGIHAQVSVRTTFGAAPPALITTPAGFFDDGIYDDPFALDTTSAQAGFTRAFGSGAELAGSVSWADRRYTSTPAVDVGGNDLTGSPLRHDRVWRGSVVWSVPVLAGRTGKTDLTLDVAYRFLRSRSNDAFYSYTSHGVGVGLSIGY